MSTISDWGCFSFRGIVFKNLEMISWTSLTNQKFKWPCIINGASRKKPGTQETGELGSQESCFWVNL